MQYAADNVLTDGRTGDQPSLQDILSLFQRRRKVMLLAFGLAMALLSLVVLLWPATYRSSATILVEAQDIPKEFVQTSVTGYVEERMQAITQMVMSRQNLTSIIDKFKLYADMRSAYTLEEITERMRKDIVIKPVKADTGPTKGGKADTTTIAFILAYEGRNPEVIAQVANTLVSLYLEENLKAREAKANITYDFLEVEAAQLRQAIQDMETKIAAFKEGNVYALPELMQVNLQALDHYQKEIEEAKANLKSLAERKIYLEGQLATVDPSGNMVSLDGRRVLTLEEEVRSLRSQYASAKATQSETHPDVVRLKAQLQAMEGELRSRAGGRGGPANAELAAKRNDLRALQGRYSDDHPDVVRLKGEIRRLEGESTSGRLTPTRLGDGENPAFINLKTQIASTELDMDAARKQLALVQAKYADYQKRIENSPRVEQEYRILQRDYTAQQTKYAETVARLQAAKEAKALEQKRVAERLTVIDPPMVPQKPASPNRPLLLLASLLLSLGIGAASGFALEFSDRSVREADEVVRIGGFPVLSAIPQVTTAEDCARARRQRVLIAIGAVAGVALLLLGIHFLVRPLDVLWFQVMRKVSLQ